MMEDIYRVLPHRDMLVTGWTITRYIHRPCLMELTESDVKEANWCPHCAAVINKAAARRGKEHILASD